MMNQWKLVIVFCSFPSLFFFPWNPINWDQNPPKSFHFGHGWKPPIRIHVDPVARLVHAVVETICHCVAGIQPTVRDPPRDTGWRSWPLPAVLQCWDWRSSKLIGTVDTYSRQYESIAQMPHTHMYIYIYYIYYICIYVYTRITYVYR